MADLNHDAKTHFNTGGRTKRTKRTKQADLSRRNLLLATAAAPIAALPGQAVAAPVNDPHPAWLAEWRVLRHRFNTEMPEEGEPLDVAFWAIEEKLFYTRAKSATGVAAQLEFALEEGIDLEGAFEGHVAMAENMLASLRDMKGGETQSEKPPRATRATCATRDPLPALVEEWRKVTRDLIAEAYKPGAGNFDTPECLALDKQRDSLAKRMGRSTPFSFEGAVALLEWADEDSDGWTVICPLNANAHRAATAYLKGLAV